MSIGIAWTCSGTLLSGKGQKILFQRDSSQGTRSPSLAHCARLFSLAGMLTTVPEMDGTHEYSVRAGLLNANDVDITL